MEDKLNSAVRVRTIVDRHLQGMKLMSAMILDGKTAVEAATTLEILALCGSKRSTFRYWGKVRKLSPADWEKTILAAFITDRGLKSRKVLPAVIRDALAAAERVSKHLSFAELHKIALDVSAKAGVECPSSRWFQRNYKKTR